MRVRALSFRNTSDTSQLLRKECTYPCRRKGRARSVVGASVSQSLASCPQSSKAPNGYTYAGDRFDRHGEIVVGRVESFGARLRDAELVKVVVGWTEVDVRASGVTLAVPRSGPCGSRCALGSFELKDNHDVQVKGDRYYRNPSPPALLRPALSRGHNLAVASTFSPTKTPYLPTATSTASRVRTAYDVTLPITRHRKAYARHHQLSPQRQQRGRSRRHEEIPRCGQGSDVRAATSQEAESCTSAPPHPTRPTHHRPHHCRDRRLRRQQGLLRPASAPLNSDTMQGHGFRHGNARGIGGVSRPG
jgi:hypothetical protein